MKCNDCDGAGTIIIQETCSDCKGWGYIETQEDCSPCDGTGIIDEVNCSSCDGTGQITVREDCDKTVDTVVDCQSCSGTGEIADPPEVVGSGGDAGGDGVISLRLCDFCHGTKKVIRRTNCSHCSATGTVPAVCDACFGKAWIDTFPLKSKCVDCDAVGMSHKNRVDCSECKGTGGVPVEETCPKCNGQGQVSA